MIEKDLKELENNFLNHLGEYYGVKTYENKAIKLKVFKRQFDKLNKNNPWVKISNVGLWELNMEMTRETKSKIIRRLIAKGIIEGRKERGCAWEIRKINEKI